MFGMTPQKLIQPVLYIIFNHRVVAGADDKAKKMMKSQLLANSLQFRFSFKHLINLKFKVYVRKNDSRVSSIKIKNIK